MQRLPNPTMLRDFYCLVGEIFVSRATHYLAFNLIRSTLLVLTLLVGLDLGINLLRELDDLGTGRYDLLTALQYLALTLPRRSLDALPAALLLGGLLGLGNLASQQELTALSAVGFGRAAQGRALLLGGGLICLVGGGLAEFVVPVSERTASVLRATARRDRIALGGGEQGFWARDGRFVVNIKAVATGFRLIDVFIYELDTYGQLLTLTHARRADYQGDGQWLLQDLRQSALQSLDGRGQTAPELRWPSVITPTLLEILAVPPETLSLRDLSRYLAYLTANDLDRSRYEFAFWRQLFTPFTWLAMTFMSLPLALSGPRSPHLGLRLLIGIVMGFGFYTGGQLVSQATLLYGLSPFWGALGMPITLSLLALLLWWQRR